MKQDEAGTRPQEAPVEQNAPKENKLVQSAKGFMNGVLSPLKGKDLGQLVEDFTSEMTLVAEGLSEDQQKLFQTQDRLAVQQTELERHVLDGLHDAQVTDGELRKEIAALRVRVDKLEKQLDQRAQDKKGRKGEGLAGILRQATWLVAIFSGAWVIVTVIRALTGT